MGHLSDVDVMQKSSEKRDGKNFVGVANMTPLSAYKLQKAKSQARAGPKRVFISVINEVAYLADGERA